MKVHNTFIREDGTIVKLVAEDFRSFWNLQPSHNDIGYFVLVTKGNELKVVHQDRMLTVVSTQEVIKTGIKLKKLLAVEI